MISFQLLPPLITNYMHAMSNNYVKNRISHVKPNIIKPEYNKLPTVGDLMYYVSTMRLAYCDGLSNDGYFLMTFSGEETPRKYSKSDILNKFRY